MLMGCLCPSGLSLPGMVTSIFSASSLCASSAASRRFLLSSSIFSMLCLTSFAICPMTGLSSAESLPISFRMAVNSPFLPRNFTFKSSTSLISLASWNALSAFCWICFSLSFIFAFSSLLQGFFQIFTGWGTPKKKKPPSHKGTKARGTTQIPAITGTLMRNEHKTGFPTALFRKPTPMGTSAASQAKDSFSSGFPESPLSGDGSLHTFHLHSHSNHNKFILTYQIGKSRNFQEKSCYSPFSRLRCSFMRRSTPFSVIA